MRTGTVATLRAAGFGIGPLGDDCAHCPHPWPDHLVEAPGRPLDGGSIRCPAEGCKCRGTWDTHLSGQHHAGTN